MLTLSFASSKATEANNLQSWWKNDMRYHNMKAGESDMQVKQQASKRSRSTSNQLNLFQLTDKLKRLTESSDQLNKNSDIQFWTSPYLWLLQDWLLCLHSAWTKLNSFYLNSSWHMLPMTYLGFCTCQIPSFCWWFGGSDHWTAQLFWVIIKWSIYFSLIEVAYIKK